MPRPRPQMPNPFQGDTKRLLDTLADRSGGTITAVPVFAKVGTPDAGAVLAGFAVGVGSRARDGEVRAEACLGESVDIEDGETGYLVVGAFGKGLDFLDLPTYTFDIFGIPEEYSVHSVLFWPAEDISVIGLVSGRNDETVIEGLLE